jgi:hypothetical protein
MPIAVMADTPNGTVENFEAVMAEIGGDLPSGCRARIAGPGPDGGWRVLSVWDDMEAAQAFLSGTLRPAQERIGVPSAQNVVTWEVHNLAT